MDGVQTVAGGILRGTGQPTRSTIINFVGYYGISIPLGIVFTFVLHWGVYGPWYVFISIPSFRFRFC